MKTACWCISKFAVAAVELRDALIVNPYDTAEVSEAIHRGLDMPREERRLRMQEMRKQVMEHNIYRWAAMIPGDLRDVRLGKRRTPGQSVLPDPCG